MLPTLNVDTVDAVVTDPPYGMNWNTDSTRFTKGKAGALRKWPRVTGDTSAFDPEPWLQFEKCVLWGANHFSQRLPVGTTLVWQKRDAERFGVVLSDAEIGWEKGGHGVYLFRCVWDGINREAEYGQHLHPTQKPVALMGWCIDRVKASCVLDPFCGSGSTLVACQERGIPAIRIEIEEQYFKTACERLRQRRLFAG